MSETHISTLNRALFEAQIRTDVGDRVRLKSRSWKYQLSVVIVAMVMILLPILYLVLIGLLIYGTYYHAIHNTWLVEDKNGRASRLILVYLLPLAINPILIVFMFKPLFAKKVDARPTQSLTPQDQPVLFALVERLSHVIRAPMPTRIDVDCDVNAHASFRRGLLSFRGNDFVLTLGLPLVAALNLPQFVGVLAHELGHFNQGVGMRLAYIIRAISLWFSRVVYERDSWDEWLLKIANYIDFRIGFVQMCAIWMIWLTRCILWCFMMVGHLVSSFLVRQMEFDADRYEIHIVGSATFESTCRQLIRLSLAAQGAYSDLEDFHREGKLADNVPRYIASLIAQIPAEILEKLDAYLRSGETGLFDTHPSEKSRIERARKEDAVGTFKHDVPASDLFDNFDELCQKSTYQLYDNVFKNEFTSSSARPYEELFEQSTHQLETRQALQRYFLNCYSPLRVIYIPHSLPVDCTEPEQALEVITNARTKMLSGLSKYVEHYLRFEELYREQLELFQVVTLHRAGLLASQSHYSVPVQIDSALDYDVKLKERIRVIEDGMADFETAVANRLYAAITLLQDPQVDDWFEDIQSTIEECRNALQMLGILNQSLPDILTIRSELAMLTILYYQIPQQTRNKKFKTELDVRMQQIHRLLEQVKTQSQQFRYPFDHAEGDVSLDRYFLRQIPASDDVEATRQVTTTFLDNWMVLYNRLSAVIVHISEHIEACFGLEPIKEP